MQQLNHAFESNLVSDLASTHSLLNCLIKEFVLPMGLFRYEWPEEIKASHLHHLFNQHLANQKTEPNSSLHPLHIVMPNQQEFFVLVDRQDNLGSQYYLSGIYAKTPNHTWQDLHFAEFVTALLESCSAITGYHNHELIEQIFDSRDLKTKIHHFARQQSGHALDNYAQSEQALWFGHPNHPAPKARLWSAQHQQHYSPEFAVATPLHHFEVPKSGLSVRSHDMSQSEILQYVAQQPENIERAIICLHPVQAKLFLQDTRVQSYIAQGLIQDLGCKGEKFVPTASIRTWYSPAHDYFIKGSLHVRITNCVRKNAWYELESTLVIDQLLKQLYAKTPETFGGFQPISEPAVVSWAPEHASETDQIWFQEQTGIILRENFCKTEGEANCLLSGTVFGKAHDLHPNILNFLQSTQNERLTDQDLIQWFEQYQVLLLKPVLNLFYHHGIVMEPHLQNCILVHENSRPVKILLRDFEGVKLTSDLGMLKVQNQTLHPRVKQAIEYSRDKGWQRICYCLFVNHLSEAILALTYQRPHLAQTMWQVVYDELVRFKANISCATPEIDELLAGAPIHCKTNFKVRLAGTADREAGYVTLASPWGLSTQRKYADLHEQTQIHQPQSPLKGAVHV